MIPGKSYNYLDKEEEWRTLVDYIRDRKITEVGLDSEFYGVDLKAGESCIGRSRVHVWSIALFDGGYSPRGYRTARGYTLPAAALEVFRPILTNPAVQKYAHNSNVDVHSIFNTASIDVLGVVNTLSLVRWMVPGRLKYGLDIICSELLGFGKFASFDEVCSRPRMVEETYKECSCGVEKCRKRKGHDKVDRTRMVPHPTLRDEIPLESIIPGHENFGLLIDYAAQDSVGALCLGDFCNELAKEQTIIIPWLQNGGL